MTFSGTWSLGGGGVLWRLTLNMLIVPVCLLHVACCLFIEFLHVPSFNMLASYVLSFICMF